MTEHKTPPPLKIPPVETPSHPSKESVKPESELVKSVKEFRDSKSVRELDEVKELPSNLPKVPLNFIEKVHAILARYGMDTMSQSKALMEIRDLIRY